LKYRQVFAAYLAYLPLAAPSHAWGNIPHSSLAGRQDVFLTPGVTSGPFMLASYTAGDNTSGQRFVMTPNSYYVSTALHPSVLDSLVFQNYNDLPSALAAYQHGQIDQVDNLMPDDLVNLSSLPGLRVTPTIGYVQLGFNLTTPALQNVYVRKAIEESIDRCQIIQTVFLVPCARLRVDTILPQPSPDFDPTIKTYSFDLRAARTDMLTAGWDCSSGLCAQDGQLFPTLRLVAPSSNSYSAIELLIKEDLGALGISVALNDFDTPTLLADFTHGGILATGQYDLGMLGQEFSVDSDTSLYPGFASAEIPTAQRPQGQNFEHVSDTDVDELLSEGRAALDSAQRSQVYKDVQRILVQKVYVVPLYLIPNITLTSSLIGNYLDNPTNQGNEWNVGDWYRAR
jgi:peptide/nickel transport system substrate-binding protein